MAPMTIQYQIDPQDYFQKGKKKITEGFKCLHDLVQWCKHNSSPENGGILHETMIYLQSLHGQIKEIESAAHQGGAAPASFNVHGTDLQLWQVIESLARQGDAFGSNPHVNEQEITQIREQNVNFKPIPNPEINMGMNKKRKLRSDVWNHFTKYENKDKEVKAQCKYCKKDFDGSSKSGTTHLRNHLKSCLKNKNKVADKMKELSVVDQELHVFDFVQKITKDDIVEIYKKEKNKLHRYLDKLPGCFNVTIGNKIGDFRVEFLMIWFIDDNWKLETRIIRLENCDSGEKPLNKGFLKLLIQEDLQNQLESMKREFGGGKESRPGPTTSDQDLKMSNHASKLIDMDMEVTIIGLDAMIRIQSSKKNHPAAKLMAALKELDLEVYHASMSVVNELLIQQATVKMGSWFYSQEQLKNILAAKVGDN